MTKVYILGNPLINKDRLPVKIIPYLRKELPQYSFIHLDPTEGIPVLENKRLILIDTVEGIKKVTLYSKFDNFSASPRFSAHDFDLTTEIPLLMKLGKIKKVYIIGIPPNYSKDKALIEVKKMLSTLLEESERRSSYKDHMP